MVYTSYFGNAEKIKRRNPSAVFVAVCGKLTPGLDGEFGKRRLKEAAPKWSWWREWHEKFKSDLDSDESQSWYAEKYSATTLAGLDPAEIGNKLGKYEKDGDVYLLCYETPEKFCHRRLFAEWLGEKLGLRVDEALTEGETT